LAITFQRAREALKAPFSHAFCSAPSSVREGSSVVVGGHGAERAASVGLHGWSSRYWRVSSRNSSALPSGSEP
jgi:hypothetical protein